MALFGKKKDDQSDKKETATQAAAAKSTKAPKVNVDTTAVVVLGPRITEKAVKASERNVYTFNVRRDANKHQVRDAIKSIYNVTPVKVNIVNKAPAKRLVGMRGKEKHVKGVKKAYVYLREGDIIQLV